MQKGRHTVAEELSILGQLRLSQDVVVIVLVITYYPNPQINISLL